MVPTIRKKRGLIRFASFVLSGILLVCGVLTLCTLFFRTWSVVRETKTAAEIAPAQGNYFMVGDLRLFVQTEGEAGNPPIVLIHGMAAWSETWRPTMRALAKEGWYVIAVDMPPFGFSERPQNGLWWRTDQAERLKVLFEVMKIERPVVVAHSYGGRAATELALRHPNLVKGLVLVNAALDGIHENDTEDAPKSIFSIGRIVSGTLAVPHIRDSLVASTLTNPLLSRKLLALFLFDESDATEDILAVYRAPAKLEHTTTYMGMWLHGFLNGKDLGISQNADQYKTLTAPTALIWGEEDTITPLSQGRRLQTLIPDSHLAVLPNIGHIPQIEDSDMFLEYLFGALQFIYSHERQ